MYPLVRSPFTQPNPQWQAALRNGSFDPLIGSMTLNTFSADRSLWFIGQPIEELSLQLHGELSNRGKVKLKNLGCALYAIAQAALASKSNQVCGLTHSEDNNAGAVDARYKAGLLPTVGVRNELKELESVGFVTRMKGMRGKGYDKGLVTLWFPSEPFVDWLTTHEQDLSVERHKTPQELLQLKASNGEKLEDYTETEATQILREQVEMTNEARQKFEWSYCLVEDDGLQFMENESRKLQPDELKCRRIFSGDFESGGRFYCPAQNLRKAERSTLEVDGNPTIEIDYKSLHPRMLYHMNNLSSPSDCYDPHGNKTVEERQLAKKAAMMVMNSKSRQSAIQALANTGKSISYEDAKATVLSFESDHSEIKQEFYSAAWKRLQYLDSQLVALVLSRCMESDIPVLPVHDSFITTTKFAVDVRAFVLQAYRDVLEFDPVLDYGEQPDLSWLEEDLGLLSTSTPL